MASEEGQGTALLEFGDDLGNSSQQKKLRTTNFRELLSGYARFLLRKLPGLDPFRAFVHQVSACQEFYSLVPRFSLFTRAVFITIINRAS